MAEGESSRAKRMTADDNNFSVNKSERTTSIIQCEPPDIDKGGDKYYMAGRRGMMSSIKARGLNDTTTIELPTV